MATKVSRPVLVMNSVLAGAGVILGGSALADFVPLPVVGLAALILAGVQVGWALYTQEQVTPTEDVAAHRIPETGEIVAGEATDIKTGSPVILAPDGDIA